MVLKVSLDPLQAWRPALRTHSSGLVGCHLPLAVVFYIHLQRADAKAVPADHFDVAVAGEYRSLAVEADREVGEGEGFVSRRSFEDGGDVLFLVLLLSARVRV